MTQFTITGDDTLTVYDRVFADLANDDVSTITFAEDLVNSETGKNRNTIFSLNEKGNNATLVLRVLRGSSDDQFLNKKLIESKKNFAATILANGQFVKHLGRGDGTVLRDVYTLQGGMVSRNVDGKESVSGDIEQGVAIYNIKFAQAQRNVE